MKTLGNYVLLKKLATGGMAELFLAKTQKADGTVHIVALKCLMSHLAQDEKFVSMFLAEAKLAALLHHPHLVQIEDFGHHEGEYFLAMEYINGPSLRAVVRRAALQKVHLPFSFCAKVVSLAAEGLGYAHDFCDPNTGQWLGLVHRDVTPENILLSRQGEVKLVDFGIAKAAAVSQTHSHSLRGKYHYMAPEQLRRNLPLDRRIDIYALGVVLYELVTGERPYDARGELALMRAILNQKMVPASRRRPDLPPLLGDIIRRALARRDERYASCDELRADLQVFLEEQTEHGETASVMQVVAQTSPADLMVEKTDEVTEEFASVPSDWTPDTRDFVGQHTAAREAVWKWMWVAALASLALVGTLLAVFKRSL